MVRKSTWLLSAGLFALSVPAYAQETDTDQGAAQPTEGATSEAAAVDNQAVETQPVDTSDIVVTATRRNEALSDVPMAVSAVTAESLEYTGATDIRQLNQVAPSLLVSSTQSEAGAGVARIRGIGTVGDNPGLESSVGVFIDGVYRSRTGAALTELGAVDRIEILRGPQGTLFGRNTSAGLISIITAKPRFQTSVYGQLDIGNYNMRRLELGATGALSETIAARIDGVLLKRDGFLDDVNSGDEINDRNRWLLRGQLLFQPNDNFSFRLIGDHSQRREECCAAVYLPTRDVIGPAGSITFGPSTIAGIIRGLGGQVLDDPYDRDIAVTPGRDFQSDVNDSGISGEAVYDFGWGELTSITAYRHNRFERGQDPDLTDLDILFRASDGDSFNRFKTFSQEFRLQGTTMDDRFDWLVGGYYANEKLRVDDNLTYGEDYQPFVNCVLFANALPSALNPSQPGCVNQGGPGGIATTIGALQAGIAAVQGGIALLQAAIANPATPPEQIPALQAQLAALQAQLVTLTGQLAQLGALNAIPSAPGYDSVAALLGLPGFNLGNVTVDDSWRQSSNNWALFTHNIFSITDELKLTVGARYTHERKELSADLMDNNTLCVAISQSPLNGAQQLPCVIPGIPGGSLSIDDDLTENKISGTAVLSYKPTDNLLTYASYSRGYKAGGFNLDRSALWRANNFGGTPPLSGSGAICVSPTQPNCGGIVASGDDLTFKPETNDAIELGAKYNGRGFDVNFAVFRQLFRNFQLNTFNGLNFIVENINSCDDDLDGGDTDNNPRTGECTGDTRAGVKNTGFELELFTRPMADLAINGGLVMANTKYRDNLVGASGRPLSNALWQLPGRRMSNSPKWTMTGSVAWTPPIGGSGLRGLVYMDVRHMSEFNTGSDLDLEKTQGKFTVVNGRIGIHGPDQRWAFELWGQNLFNEDFMQVAFDAPVQGTPGSSFRGVEAGFFPRATQLFGAFLGEPRTFGATLRYKWTPAPAAAPYVAPPPPPPPPAPPATQTCPDGSVILATDTCPLPPPPPPPPPPAPERG